MISTEASGLSLTLTADYIFKVKQDLFIPIFFILSYTLGMSSLHMQVLPPCGQTMLLHYSLCVDGVPQIKPQGLVGMLA